MPGIQNGVQGPTQWVEALERGEIAVPYNPTASAPQIGQMGVDVAAAVAAAGAEGQTLSEEDREAIGAVLRGEADPKTVTKEKLVAAIHLVNEALDDDQHLTVDGNKDDLIERLRGLSDAH